jgi:hypothetical protein
VTDDRRRDALREAEIQRFVQSATSDPRRHHIAGGARAALAGLLAHLRASRRRQRIEALGNQLPSA